VNSNKNPLKKSISLSLEKKRNEIMVNNMGSMAFEPPNLIFLKAWM